MVCTKMNYSDSRNSSAVGLVISGTAHFRLVLGLTGSGYPESVVFLVFKIFHSFTKVLLLSTVFN